MNEIEIVLIVKINQKTGKKYSLLAFDLGYKRVYIELNQYKIAEYFKTSIEKLQSMEVGEYPCGSLLKLD